MYIPTYMDNRYISVHQHMTFVAVNRLFLQVYINPHPMFLMNNIKLNEIQTKIKQKILALFHIAFQYLKINNTYKNLYKNEKIKSPVFLFAIARVTLD